ncbi:MAG TPA: DUF2490 domain-containing protein [Flavobacteriales bacterium]|nr:DUF2490 domain-containing protein [Flavobacteriales bacterium]HRE95842.1 DUF2490 domain-containing protein [Flavobacteriales bacterium]HRJ37023.1 DUF2490 domain-containing protein [Flavobacteriales bacterium]HRJ37610.1 DUF2490 domain-containing protein [Flavobacteriales bacterium]
MQDNFTCLRFAITLMLSAMLMEVCAQTQDAQLWSGIEIEQKFNKEHAAQLKTQFRLGDNFSRADYSYVDLGYQYSPNKVIDASAGYSLNMRNHYIRGWGSRHQWYTYVTITKKIGDLKIANRNQFQSDIEDASQNEGSFFYRNRIQLRYKVNETLTPFASAEGYLRLGQRPPNENFFYRTRYIAGLHFNISKRQRIELSYLLQRQIRRDVPDYIHAYCINYSITLK